MMESTNAPALSDERARFEAWAKFNGWGSLTSLALDERDSSHYQNLQLNGLWHGWKARAQAGSAAPAAPVAEGVQRALYLGLQYTKESLSRAEGKTDTHARHIDVIESALAGQPAGVVDALSECKHQRSTWAGAGHPLICAECGKETSGKLSEVVAYQGDE